MNALLSSPSVFVRDIVTKHQNLEIRTLRYLLEKKCIFCFFLAKKKNFSSKKRDENQGATIQRKKERFHLIFTKLFLGVANF